MNQIKKVVEQIENQKLASYLQAACRAALEGGSIVKDLYNKPHSITMKGEIDLVTEADVASETAIVASLEQDVPGIEVMAEESAGTELIASSELTWVIDPLDGTTNFAHGLPVFAVSIALLENSSPVVGAIYCPMQDELFCGLKKNGAWLNGKQIQVTQTSMLIEALLATGFPYNIHDNLETIISQVKAVLPKVRDIRRAGAAAVDLAWLACGRLDGFWELELKPWDTAAGWLLVEEAGGKVSDFSGNTFSCFGRETLASNGALHTELVSMLVTEDGDHSLS